MPRTLPILFVCSLAGAPAAGAAVDAPGAYELLQGVREAYAALDTYRDEGEITIRAGSQASDESRFLFRTEAIPGERFEIRFEPERGATGGHADLDPELLARLGPGAREALVAPALLARGSASVADPAAALIEGQEPCGAATCWLLAGAGPGGEISWRLRVDAGTHLIRGVEVEVSGPDPRSIRVEHRILEATRRGAARSAGAGEEGEPSTGFSDRIEVALTTLTVRVVDRAGNPIPGLGPGDFRLRAGRRQIELEAAEWVDPARPWAEDLPAGELEAAGVRAPIPGRLIVLFVQTSLQGSRLAGQTRMLPHAQRFLDSLGPDDRIAVVSFDSHLKLRQDFTRDRDRLREALERAITHAPAPPPRATRALSLARHFEFDEALRAATPERALELAARALIPFEGDKVVVWLGWGLGELTSFGVRMPREYDDALRALDAARASVFVLDVSDSDYHSLELGLRQVAADTGGTYSKTQDFPAAMTDRLARTLSGHYLLYFRAPDLEPGIRLRVELREGLEGEVLAPGFVLN